MKISTYRVSFKDIYAYRACLLHALSEWLFFYFKYIVCNVTCNAKELMRSVERQIRIQFYDVLFSTAIQYVQNHHPAHNTTESF